MNQKPDFSIGEIMKPDFYIAESDDESDSEHDLNDTSSNTCPTLESEYSDRDDELNTEDESNDSSTCASPTFEVENSSKDDEMGTEAESDDSSSTASPPTIDVENSSNDDEMGIEGESNDFSSTATPSTIDVENTSKHGELGAEAELNDSSSCASPTIDVEQSSSDDESSSEIDSINFAPTVIPTFTICRVVQPAQLVPVKYENNEFHIVLRRVLMEDGRLIWEVRLKREGQEHPDWEAYSSKKLCDLFPL